MRDDFAIWLDGVSKTYKVGRERLHAVDNVSLGVRPGELVAVVGPSGSGKTTLTHIIGGLLKPDKGQVVVNGRAIGSLRDRALSRYRNKQVGFIFQNFSLLPGYSALDNVSVPLIVAGVPPAERRGLAREYLRLVGLEQQAKQRTEQLSGGQRQRVAIARALAMQPGIVIADEPTGSLDSARGHEIMDILQTLAARGLTVLFVTHDLDLAARATRQLHMRDGHLIERPASARA
jgi:putative ABC transport system ATP-binding protein